MLGQHLWAAYLEEVFPSTERPAINEVGLTEIGKAIWSIEARLRGFVDEAADEPDATIDSVEEALWRIARQGDLEAVRDAPAMILAALVARTRWALTLVAVEHAGGGAFRVPLPVHASDDVRATAAFLVVLGHPDVIAAVEGRL